MNEFVVRANIERFEKALRAEKDRAKAAVLRDLLARERGKLAEPWPPGPARSR